MTRPLRLITFDLDDTLWPVGPVIQRAEHRMRDFLDAQAPTVNKRFDRDGMAVLRDQVLQQQPQLVHDISTLRRLILKAALEACGYRNVDALAEQAFAAFLDARHDVEYFEDALDTLAYLSRHYTLGALSNGNADIARLGLDQYFSFHLSAESVGRRKPDPEMFERALQQAGVGPEAAVHVGDHVDDDIRGAANVGMATIWVNRPGQPWPETDVTPTWEIQELTELRSILAHSS